MLSENWLWWRGPDFLSKPREYWPTVDHSASADTCNVDTNGDSVSVNLAIANQQSLDETISVERFNDLNKLLRVTALILRFVRNVRARVSKNEAIVDELNHQEIEQARLTWLL